MKFEDVIQAFRDGKRVRRSSWSNPSWYLHMGRVCDGCNNILDKEDLFAEDWEIWEVKT